MASISPCTIVFVRLRLVRCAVKGRLMMRQRSHERLTREHFCARQVRQLLDALVGKYRLALWIGHPQFYVRLSAADAQRLRAASTELLPDVVIEDLNVEQLELVKRTSALWSPSGCGVVLCLWWPLGLLVSWLLAWSFRA